MIQFDGSHIFQMGGVGKKPPTSHVFSQCLVFHLMHMCQGLNYHYFHIIGDGHQPNSRGLYTHYKDSLLKGGMTIPNIATFDHGTYDDHLCFPHVMSW